MPIAVAQMDIAPGRPEANLSRMLELIDEAKAGGAELVLFPELAISGLLLGDLAADEAFVAECLAAGQQLAAAAQDMMVVYGNLDYRNGLLYNAVYLAYNGENGRLSAPMGAAYAAGAYAGFGEAREFQAYHLPLDGKVYRVGFMLGDWQGDAIPFAAGDIDLLVDLSQKPLALDRREGRAPLAGRQYISVNACGLANSGKTCYLFPGNSYYLDFDGAVIARAHTLRQGLYFWQRRGGPLSPEPAEAELLAEALTLGTRLFLEQIRAKRAVIGISGGIDSALAACIYSRALGADNVYLIGMPGQFTSDLTRELAAGMARGLNTPFAEIAVEEDVTALIRNLGCHPFTRPGGPEIGLEIDSAARENIYARDRARILAAAAASLGGVFTCNSNKAECAVGYSTFYGDLAGAFAAQADLWKFQVYQASAWMQKLFPEAPLSRIAAIRPSAELSAAQDITKGLGDPLIYKYHDYLLRFWVEQGQDLSVTLRLYGEGALESAIGCAPGLTGELFPDAAAFIADSERWWRNYRGIGVAKRLQAPPLLAVSSRPFGEAKPQIQAAPYESAAYRKIKRGLLGL